MVKRRLPGWILPATFFALALSHARDGAAETELGVGVLGAVGGNFLDKPDRPAGFPDIYPGFGGATYGVGLFAEIRFIKLLGLEVDMIRSSDHGKGTVKFSGFDLDMTLGQSAWHVPVLAKLTVDAPLVAPMFFIGPEFVFPGDPEMDSNLPAGVPDNTFQAHADSYTMVTFGGGLEIKLPLPAIDLRLPIALRLSYNPSVPSDITDRIRAKGTVVAPQFVYDSEWKYAVGATAGAALWF